MSLRQKIIEEIALANKKSALLNRNFSGLHQIKKKKSRGRKYIFAQKVLTQSMEVKNEID